MQVSVETRLVRHFDLHGVRPFGDAIAGYRNLEIDRLLSDGNLDDGRRNFVRPRRMTSGTLTGSVFPVTEMVTVP